MHKNPAKTKKRAKPRKQSVTHAHGAGTARGGVGPQATGGNGKSERENREHHSGRKDGRQTHVLVPVDEYEELIKSGMVARAVAKIESGKADFVDARDFALVLAADRIARARKAKGLTQKQLGAKLKLPQSQISRIERNPDHTTIRTLKRIARALGVDIAALV